MYASNTVLVRKEEIAFPLDSLVADVGGILGLFIGFNFLMIWELIIDFVLILMNKVKNAIKSNELDILYLNHK